jgi:hypothetical protein
MMHNVGLVNHSPADYITDQGEFPLAIAQVIGQRNEIYGQTLGAHLHHGQEHTRIIACEIVGGETFG